MEIFLVLEKAVWLVPLMGGNT